MLIKFLFYITFYIIFTRGGRVNIGEYSIISTGHGMQMTDIWIGKNILKVNWIEILICMQIWGPGYWITKKKMSKKCGQKYP